MIAFLFNGIITIFTAFTYAELSSALPDTGGGYRWVREGMPRPNAFLSGWMSWFAHTIAGSLYAVAFASFFAHLLDTAKILESSIFLEKGLAAIAIIAFTFINVRGTSQTSKVGNVITISQITIIRNNSP
ncbi:MAG: amino acid permease [Nitrososphaeria archaeon]|nr:amino acid permease [Nitrososphaeria archaeon]